MNQTQPNIEISVDLTNPGRLFACCGLLELVDRLWSEAEGWSELIHFHIGEMRQGSVWRFVTELRGLRFFVRDDAANSAAKGTTPGNGSLRSN